MVNISRYLFGSHIIIYKPSVRRNRNLIGLTLSPLITDTEFKLLNLSPEMNFRLIRFHNKANVKKIKISADGRVTETNP